MVIVCLWGGGRLFARAECQCLWNKLKVWSCLKLYHFKNDLKTQVKNLHPSSESCETFWTVFTALQLLSPPLCTLAWHRGRGLQSQRAGAENPTSTRQHMPGVLLGNTSCFHSTLKESRPPTLRPQCGEPNHTKRGQLGGSHQKHTPIVNHNTNADNQTLSKSPFLWAQPFDKQQRLTPAHLRMDSLVTIAHDPTAWF